MCTRSHLQRAPNGCSGVVDVLLVCKDRKKPAIPTIFGTKFKEYRSNTCSFERFHDGTERKEMKLCRKHGLYQLCSALLDANDDTGERFTFSYHGLNGFAIKLKCPPGFRRADTCRAPKPRQRERRKEKKVSSRWRPSNRWRTRSRGSLAWRN